MKKSLIIFLMAMVFSSVGLFANSEFKADKIKEIVLHDFGYILIQLEKAVNTSEPCDDKTYLILEQGTLFYKEKYAALLSAFYTGKKIKGWVNGTAGHRNFPRLTRLDVLNY